MSLTDRERDDLNCPHCGDHIDTHPASRCLDAWVAEAVMEWQPVTHFHGSSIADGWTGFWDGEWFRWIERPESKEPDETEVWLPSVDIAAAWEVVEKLPAKSMVLLDRHWLDEENLEWMADLISVNGERRARVWAETAPLAICRAAIKAVQG